MNERFWDNLEIILAEKDLTWAELARKVFNGQSRNKAHNGILSFFSWYILQSVTCHLLFVTLTYPVENTRVYKRASSPLCFLCVYVAFSSQQTTRTHWRK